MSAMRNVLTLVITTESLAFGTFVVDDSHQVISWNEIATRTLGFDSGMTLGRTCEEMLALLHTQDALVCPDIAAIPGSGESATARWPSEARPLDPHAFRHHEDAPAPVRVRVTTQHGASRWLEMSIVPARKLDGSACVIHIFRDVTEDAGENEHGAVAAHALHHPGAILHLPVRGTESADDENTPKIALEHLTPREHEVLELLAQGMATVEIATELGISRVTARNHVTRVIEKLGVKTRLQAVLAASRLGLI